MSYCSSASVTELACARRPERRCGQTVRLDFPLGGRLVCAIDCFGREERAAAQSARVRVLELIARSACARRRSLSAGAAAAAAAAGAARFGDGRAVGARAAGELESVHAAGRDAPVPRGALSPQGVGRAARTCRRAAREERTRAARPAPAVQLRGSSLPPPLLQWPVASGQWPVAVQICSDHWLRLQ